MNKLDDMTIASLSLPRSAIKATLMLCVVLLFAATANAQNRVNGPRATIDSLTDSGNGKITVAWSFEELESNQTAIFDKPLKICAKWTVKKDGQRGEISEKCITDGFSSQNDIEIDTGLSANAPSSQYTVALYTWYVEGGAQGGIPDWVDVTLNDSN